MNKTALVTGAGGTLGSRLTARLIDAGWQVRALVLPGDPQGERLARAGCDVREGDVSDASSLGGLSTGIDTVYHLAAIILSHDPSAFGRVNLEGTTNMVASAASASVRHFIYVSSASVTYPRLTPYGESKLAAERVVTRETALGHTIVRPTLVYERGGGLELQIFLRYLQRFPIVPFIGQGAALKRPVHAADVVDGLFRLAGHPSALGKLYNFSGGEAISMFEFAQLLLRLRGHSAPVFACAGAALFGDRGSSGPRHGSSPPHQERHRRNHPRRQPRPLVCHARLGVRPDRRAPGAPSLFRQSVCARERRSWFIE